MRAAALLLVILFFLIPGTAAGMIPVGEPVTASETIFVGEWFDNDYTLEFDTGLTDAVWHMNLITQNRTTREWDFSYPHAEISGFTISVPEHDTWLEASVTGTPSVYDEGTEIILWKMQVKLANGGVRDTFSTAPVLVGPKTTTVLKTPTTAPQKTETVSPAPTPVTVTDPVPETIRTLTGHGTYVPSPTEPAARDSPEPGCGILLVMGAVCLPILRKTPGIRHKMSTEQ